MQQPDIAERVQRVVQVLAVRAIGDTAGIDRQSGDGGGSESLQEFAPLHDSMVARARDAGHARRRIGFTG
jgi:hypothetical protein